MKRENQNIYQLGCILNIFLNNCWNKEELKTLFRNTIQRRTTVKACVQSRFWAGSNGKQVQLIWTENELINRTLGLPGSPMIKTLCFHCRGCCFVVQSLNRVVSYSLQPHGLWPARLLCPWDFPGKNTGEVISFSRGSFRPRGWTHVSCIGSCIFKLNHQEGPHCRGLGFNS